MTTSPAAQLHTTGRVLHWAARYDLLVWLLTHGRDRAFRETPIGLAGLAPGESVLDVGCGTGSLAIAASRQVGTDGEVCGVDACSGTFTATGTWIRGTSCRCSRTRACAALTTTSAAFSTSWLCRGEQ